jgi:hypothetical protein
MLLAALSRKLMPQVPFISAGSGFKRLGDATPIFKKAQPVKLPRHEEQSMLDLILLALGLSLFAASIGYAYACERL